jgi:probable HAF family extracellular repeat protein
VGAAETLVPLSSQSNGWPCFPGPNVNHALRYHDGHTTDLGALSSSSTDCSNAQTINDSGEIVGVSENGVIDPVLGINEMHGFIFKYGHMADLGTLGGNVSYAASINNRGQVVGFATNTIPDPNSMYYLLAQGSPNGTQTRAYLWQDGSMQDLGTLGGPDAQALYVNEEGQVAGLAYLNSIVNPLTGVPTQDTFLWQNGRMRDLGNLGGSVGGPNGMNNRGQVVGTSNIAGDQLFHPFLWDGRRLLDLGTLGGSTGNAIAINDAGEVAAEADLPGDQTHDAFLWKNGVVTDLGNLGVTSFPHAISPSGQVVGSSRIDATLGNGRAFLWEDGGPMVDLNTLIPSNSSLTLVYAYTINERGEIGGTGVPAGCGAPDVATCGHAFLLIPCDEKHPGECEDYSMIEGSASQTSASTAEFSAPATQRNQSQEETVNPARNRFGRGFPTPGQPAGPRD